MEKRDRNRLLRRFAVVVLRTPKYARLAASLARDNRLTGGERARAVASLGYALSPIDLLPGVIPVVGQLDDLAVLIGGLRGVVLDCPQEVAQNHLQWSGLDLDTMEEDLATVGATGRWVARVAAGLVRKAVTTSVRNVVGLVASRVHRGRLPPSWGTPPAPRV